MVRHGVSLKRGFTYAIALNKDIIVDEIEVYKAMLECLSDKDFYTQCFENDNMAPDELKELLQSVIDTITPEIEKISLEDIDFKAKLKPSLNYRKGERHASFK